MAEHLKHAAFVLGLLNLLVAMWRTPPGDLLSVLIKLGPLLFMLTGGW
jgi:hypothetical protein